MVVIRFAVTWSSWSIPEAFRSAPVWTDPRLMMTVQLRLWDGSGLAFFVATLISWILSSLTSRFGGNTLLFSSPEKKSPDFYQDEGLLVIGRVVFLLHVRGRKLRVLLLKHIFNRQSRVSPTSRGSWYYWLLNLWGILKFKLDCFLTVPRPTWDFSFLGSTET